MDDERLRILEMVQAGTISVDEAERLLAALEAPPEPAPVLAATVPPPGAPSPAEPTLRPYWEIPFAVGLLLLGLAGLCVANASSTLLSLCGWSCGLSAALLVAAAWLSRWSRWIHVRIHEQDGTRLTFSLPLPLRFLSPLLGVARPLVGRFADEDTLANLDAALGMVSALGDLPAGEPLSVEVDDEDGDHIRVFIG